MAKRRAKGDGSIRKRSDGRWEAMYTVGRNPATGKQVRKSVYGKTQNEVRQKLKTITAEIDKGTYTDCGKSLTVKQWFNIWLKEYTGNVKPDTLNAYTYHANRHIIAHIGALKLSNLSPHHIQTLYNNLQTQDNLSPKSIINLHGVMSSALNKAVTLGYIPVNPAGGVTLPRKDKTIITPLNEAETVSFLQTIKDTKDNTILNVALFTGMRISELIGLTWDCVDFKNGTILIDKQLKRDKDTGRYYFGTPKNGKFRKIMPAPFIMDMLSHHKSEQAQMKFIACDVWDTEFENLVFTNEIGEHIYPNALTRRFKRYLDRAGIENHRFHDLRHTYAVNSLRSGDDLKTLQENLGHSTASFTLDMYAHVTDDMRRDSSMRMQEFANRITSLF